MKHEMAIVSVWCCLKWELTSFRYAHSIRGAPF